MTKQETFALWSPEHSLWSTWAKPVLFAHMPVLEPMPLTNEVPQDVPAFPTSDRNSAIVIDLPGDEGVWLSLALAEKNFRPVPVYNALPLPFGYPITFPETGRPTAAVDVLSIVSALHRGTQVLHNTRIASDAPPVFLLDANRHGNGMPVVEDQFDNRSVCFTTDFPSANFLLAHGITKALVVQRGRDEPLEDLTHVLRRWQDGGIILERFRVDVPDAPKPLKIPKPLWFGQMFQRALIAVGLRKSGAGGFGNWMPDSSSGG